MKAASTLGLAMAAAIAGAAWAQQPAPHPLTKPLTLADAVPDAKGIHRMAILRGLDKITGRATDMNAPVGVPIHFGTLTITVRYCHTVPPEEPPETTAFLQIDETPPKAPAPMRLFSGWMFASSPALNALQRPIYDVWVITCKTDEPAPEPTASAGLPTLPAPPVAPADATPAPSNP
jgi:hypothetical protein